MRKGLFHVYYITRDLLNSMLHNTEKTSFTVHGLPAITLLAITLFMTGCGHKITSVDNSATNRGGWVTDDIYRISVKGIAPRSERDTAARKHSARRAAIMNARFKILKQFKKYSIESGKKMGIPQSSSCANIVKASIKSGTVIYQEYDSYDNCRIIYEVRSRGLRQNVIKADLRGIVVIY